MFLISTDTGNVADLVLKNKSIDVKNIPPSASIKNDSANGSPQPLSSPGSISTNLATLVSIGRRGNSKGGSILGGKIGGGTGIGGGTIGGSIGGGGGGNTTTGGGGGGGGGGVNIGKSGNGGSGGGSGGCGGATGGGGGNEPSPVTFSLSPLRVIVLSPLNLSNTTLPFLVETTSVCELFNNPCA